MSTERMQRIGEGAIAVLAERGARGLTHRAVDTYLKLSQGSTSYYCKTRAALVDLTAATVMIQDWEDFRRFTLKRRVDLEGLLAHLGSPACRARMLARFELYLEGARNEAFRPKLLKHRRDFISFVADALSHANGASELPRQSAAEALVGRFEARLFHQMAFGAWAVEDAPDIPGPDSLPASRQREAGGRRRRNSP